MIDFKEYTLQNDGKHVFISTISGKTDGMLTGSKTDQDGNITALVLRKYFHRIEVPTEEILNIRLS
jgi:hypothetical protein